MSKMKFDKAIGRFEKIRYGLPKIIADDSVRFFLDGFNKEGFTDTAFKAWKPRKGKQSGRNATRKILVDSGALRRSVSNSVKVATWDLIKFQVELPYAKYVQEGTDKMPARKFIGLSKQLMLQNQKKIRQVIDKIWRA
jgi:phage gpG-like protein